MDRIAPFVTLVIICVAGQAAAVSWEWQCDVDPTTLDANKDKVLDWVVRGADNPGSFDTNNLADGTWLGGQLLDTRPKDDFCNPTVIDIRWKATAAGDWKACFWINIDYSDNGTPSPDDDTFSPVYVFLSNDGISQTMTFYNVYMSWAARQLAQYVDLPTDFIDMHLEFDTAADTLAIALNGEPKDTVSYTAWGPPNADRFATILGSNVVFDSVRIFEKSLYIPGDANLDCTVNILDLIFIRNKLGQSPSTGDNWSADLNHDDRINILDLIATRTELGKKCGN
ncbi:MAG TPA: dockerin type I domain-containing protein [Planctomycetota bacterium]|nr:dockerin type I domain-containing protein [Planctomycetota bacterium]